VYPGGYGPSQPQAPYGQHPGPAYPQGPAGHPGFRPGPAPKPKTSGCLIAFLIFLGVGTVGLIGVAIFVYVRFGSLFGGMGEVAEVALEAQSANGTQQLRDEGCDQAYAIDAERLEKAVNRVEREIAKQEGRAAKPVDLSKKAEFFVACSVASGKGPSCAKVAKIYIDATSPKGNIVVQVSSNGQAKKSQCAERYAPDGTKLGSVESVDLPTD